MGRTPSDHRQGIQELLDASSPGTCRGWTAEKVTLTIALDRDVGRQLGSIFRF
jgi:hypothetical protein